MLSISKVIQQPLSRSKSAYKVIQQPLSCSKLVYKSRLFGLAKDPRHFTNSPEITFFTATSIFLPLCVYWVVWVWVFNVVVDLFTMGLLQAFQPLCVCTGSNMQVVKGSCRPFICCVWVCDCQIRLMVVTGWVNISIF